MGDDAVIGDLDAPERVLDQPVAARLRVRRDRPGALVALEDGRYAVTGPIIVAGSRDDVTTYARRRAGRADPDDRAWLQTVVGALAIDIFDAAPVQVPRRCAASRGDPRMVRTMIDPRSGAVVEGRMRDDRVFRSTRVLGAVIVPFLLVAFALLYFFPDDTRHWFAWDVQPTITPLIMGAGYIAGAYFFVRVARETRWHRIQVGFLPVTAFTLFMAIGTFNHLDRFATAARRVLDLGRAVRRRRRCSCRWPGGATAGPIRGTPEPGEPPLPPCVRRRCSIVGGVQSLVALVLLLSPSTMIEHWPWLLTPLTAQTLGGWFALPGVTALMMGLDGRWSAIRITLESQLIGLALILLGTARAWEDVDTSNALAYVFVAGIAGAVRRAARARVAHGQPAAREPGAGSRRSGTLNDLPLAIMGRSHDAVAGDRE